MKSIIIGDCAIRIKDYYCSDGTGYHQREDGKLWLYVNVTNQCNGSCPFCINPSRNNGDNPFSIDRFRAVLSQISKHVYGVSITGGEPMLDSVLVDDVISAVTEVFEGPVEIDIVTNGTNIMSIPKLKELSNIDTIHISRHRIADAENRQLFGFEAPTALMLRELTGQLSDPGKVVLNCILMKDEIDSVQRMADYLDLSVSIGVQNNCFIGLSVCNSFCDAHYIDPASMDMTADSRFHIWNQYKDHNYCSCSAGHYEATSGTTRFYFRRIGHERAPYARQLVYTADNKLLAGFGGFVISI